MTDLTPSVRAVCKCTGESQLITRQTVSGDAFYLGRTWTGYVG